MEETEYRLVKNNLHQHPDYHEYYFVKLIYKNKKLADFEKVDLKATSKVDLLDLMDKLLDGAKKETILQTILNSLYLRRWKNLN